MLRNFGAVELLIILAIVVLLFGVGRISGLGKELGTAISEFRKGLRSDDTAEDEQADENDEV
ncbi:MAG TPA: twin-arginine translocase TatA/TatE family subunit [Aggregatilineales bacterium]|nr:twin-arginine translocase TatA/TatE family subunit [Chloroflexota bacterium]HOA22843.1 twin-arginine translocase TatA/TatE family subunit [Aggregatilineales bacterium]HPV05791.1 twin-arginine translocase TatA/TatE family subunit [Aggregatilineales bacterium]HQA69820.1 twin-arginine translocase TatA/TatE family subunit [Aggregatilineales bacterium]HQE19062.1 twin-arginine translocase TatA/TatE family subunit [Aggregatilineales bacterium]